MFSWGIEQYGGRVIVDDYSQMPTGTIASIDIETNGREVNDPEFKIVCIGLTCDGVNCHIFFDLRPELFSYLQSVQMVCHNGKGAEIPWLSKSGISIEQLYFDTKIGYYVYDSTRKNYSLKPLIKDLFNVEYPTYEEIITDSVMIQNACDLDSSRLTKDKKGNPKYPKTLSLDNFPKEYVAAYNACDIFWTHKIYTWLRQHFSVAQTKFFEQIEMPMNRLIYEMENKGVKIDTKIIRRIHNENSKARRRAKKSIFELAGKSFNINSPKQVLEVLRNTGCNIKSTGEEVLVKYTNYPIVNELLEYRKRQKLCSTYTIPLYTEAIKNENNRIHARFNQSTITGRLSSSDPINLQNQPKGIREGFVAEEGNRLIGSDWTNVELYLPANFSEEPGFIEELNKPDGDLHTRTAKFLFGNHIESLPEGERKEYRAKAKTCNFLLTNSGTARRLANELNIQESIAEDLFKRFWKGYPTLEAWLKEEKKKARERGGVTTLYGRWVPIPTLSLWCGRSNCPVFGPSGYFCKQCFMREEAERSAISVIVQGSSSDLMKLAALRLKKEENLVPIISCHDELVYEVREEDVNLSKHKIKHAMENIHSFKVQLKANVKDGHSWKEAH